jgi:hypothetical protein
MSNYRTLTITDNVTLVTEECCACGVLFAMAAAFRQQCLDKPGPDGKSFYCPAGHSQYYTGISAAEKIRRERERAERLAQQVASREEDLRVERASHTATRGALTKTRNKLKSTERRVANGVCPCCHRTFKQLSRHMSGQHPEYVEATS